MRGSGEILAAVLLVAVSVVLAASYFSFQMGVQSSMTGAVTSTLVKNPPIIVSAIARPGTYGYDVNLFVKNLSADGNTSLYLLSVNGVVMSRAVPEHVSCSGELCEVSARFVADPGIYTILLSADNGIASRNLRFPDTGGIFWCSSCSSCASALMSAADATWTIDGNAIVYLLTDISATGTPCIALSSPNVRPGSAVIFDGQGHRIFVSSPSTGSGDPAYALLFSDANHLILRNVTVISTDSPCAGTISIVRSIFDLVDANIYNTCANPSVALSLDGAESKFLSYKGIRICSQYSNAFDVNSLSASCVCDAPIYWFDTNETSTFPADCACATKVLSYAECTGTAGG